MLYRRHKNKMGKVKKGTNIPQQQAVPNMPQEEKQAEPIRGTKKQQTEVDKAIKIIMRYMIETGATKIEARERDLGFELFARFEAKEGGRQ